MTLYECPNCASVLTRDACTCGGKASPIDPRRLRMAMRWQASKTEAPEAGPIRIAVCPKCATDLLEWGGQYRCYDCDRVYRATDELIWQAASHR